ncbi:MAG: ATP-dependent DNA helicase [Acidimicrobiales bacterium]
MTDRGPKTVSDLLEEAASLLPKSEERPGQIEMARAVERAIKERRHLVVQAGTGTGKSLAYLVPAIRAGTRVVIATATKALQDQLATKDLPLVARLRPPGSFKFAVLKGRSNYLCRQRASETGLSTNAPGAVVSQTLGGSFDTGTESAAQAQKAGPGSSNLGPRLADQIKQLVAWGDESPTGDRAELDFEPDARAWAAVSIGPRECPGAFRCPSGEACFTEQARARASEADIIVVNTHLYATHVASGETVLPDHDILIFDEAHEVEDVMTSGLGVELTPGRIRALAQGARGLVSKDDQGTVDGLLSVADVFEAQLRPLIGMRIQTAVEKAPPTSRKSQPSQHPRSDREDSDSSEPGGLSFQFEDQNGARSRPPAARPFKDRTSFRSSAGATDLALVDLLTMTGSRVAAIMQALRQAERGGPQSDDPDASAKRRRSVQAASHLAEDVRALCDADSDHVVWVESSGAGGRVVSLRMAPIDIGPLLAERLWPNVTAVLTSATIPPGSEKRLGLPPERTDRVDVQSPFPYGERALLYCATDLPDRRTPEAEDAIADELAELITAAGGRTLALFTSWRAMTAAHERLRSELEFPLYAQGELPKQRLIEAFTADEAACLFATVSFWQGVDIPGRTLTLVTVDRLPFARPDDPLVQARRDKAGDRAFSLVDLPRAATLLAQGAGRLIRSADDTGVVAVLDRRLATASYGRILRASVPPMRWTTDRKVAVSFLERAAEAVSS